MAATRNFITSKPGQLIDGAGIFREGVGRELGFDDDRGLVGVVSIMGVQSSGKSTLMNKCFSTDFKEMNQESGMSQTTKGIWMSKVSFPDVGDSGHKVLLLDCEGSDGAERGQEGNETFEKKVTLFALASSEVVMINMKCDSVNLYNGAGMPLIRNVFQVMVRKFNTPRLVTLLFVLRDKNKVPLKKLKEQLITQLTSIWNTVCEDLTPRPAALESYFKVEVVALSHYLYAEDAFMAEVVDLRKLVFEAVENGKLNPAANFISLTQRNWTDIQTDKILNLQLNQNSVDGEFFKKIKEDIVQKFSQNKDWIKMRINVRRSIAEGFGDFVSSLIESHISEFDEETQSFNENLRDDSRSQLTQSLLEVVEDSYHSFLKTKKLTYMEKFKRELKGKKEAVDNNFSAEPYIYGFFNSIKEARVKQADEWTEAYESFADVKSSISDEVDYAHKAINQLVRQKKEAEEQARKASSSGGNFITDVVLGPPLPIQIAKLIAPDNGVINDIDKGFRDVQKGVLSVFGL